MRAERRCILLVPPRPRRVAASVRVLDGSEPRRVFPAGGASCAPFYVSRCRCGRWESRSTDSHLRMHRFCSGSPHEMHKGAPERLAPEGAQ